MPAYDFQARNPQGELISGVEHAADVASLRGELARRGMLLVDARSGNPRQSFRLGARRVRPAALLSFISEFRHLAQTGLPLPRVLSILQDRPDDPVLSDAVAILIEGIENGLPLDQAAAAADHVFDQTIRAAFRAGDRSGQLAEVLQNVEAHLAQREDIRRTLRRSLTYPAFLMVLLFVVLAVLMLFVLPRFADLYAEFGADLPAATRILMIVVNWAPIWVPGSIFGLAALSFAFRKFQQSPSGRSIIDRTLLRLAVVGPVVLGEQLALFASTLAMYLKAGAPLAVALADARDGLTNSVMRGAVDGIIRDVRAGRSLSDAVGDAGLFPAVSLGLIRAGDAAGTPAALLEAVAALHLRQVQDRVAQLLGLVEPGMILFVGIVLGSVIVTVYLPVFGIAGVVQ